MTITNRLISFEDSIKRSDAICKPPFVSIVKALQNLQGLPGNNVKTFFFTSTKHKVINCPFKNCISGIIESFILRNYTLSKNQNKFFKMKLAPVSWISSTFPSA